MLIHLQVTARENAEKRTGGTVLNTDFITEMTVSGTGAAFRYCPQAESRRGSHERITVSDTVTRIQAIMNQAYAQTSITLSVFPEEDLTATTVWTTFNIAEIEEGWPYSRANRQAVNASGTNADSMSYVKINEKGQIKRYIIDHYYMELVMLSRTVSTSTTTS